MRRDSARPIREIVPCNQTGIYDPNMTIDDGQRAQNTTIIAKIHAGIVRFPIGVNIYNTPINCIFAEFVIFYFFL